MWFDLNRHTHAGCIFECHTYLPTNIRYSTPTPYRFELSISEKSKHKTSNPTNMARTSQFASRLASTRLASPRRRGASTPTSSTGYRRRSARIAAMAAATSNRPVTSWVAPPSPFFVPNPSDDVEPVYLPNGPAFPVFEEEPAWMREPSPACSPSSPCFSPAQ